MTEPSHRRTLMPESTQGATRSRTARRFLSRARREKSARTIILSWFGGRGPCPAGARSPTIIGLRGVNFHSKEPCEYEKPANESRRERDVIGGVEPWCQQVVKSGQGGRVRMCTLSRFRSSRATGSVAAWESAPPFQTCGHCFRHSTTRGVALLTDVHLRWG